MIRTLATIAAALILTACGTSSIGDDNTPADGPTAAALAAKLDCTGDDGTDTNASVVVKGLSRDTVTL